MHTEIRRVRAPEEMRSLLAFDRKVFQESDRFARDYWLELESFWLLVDGVKAGCCAFERRKGALYVATTGVLPRFQGLGLGTLMKSWQVAYARRRGFERLVAHTRRSNASMIGLNRKFGFRVVRTVPGYYSDPPEAAVVMELVMEPRRRV